MRKEIGELGGLVIIGEELRRRVNMRREGKGEREKRLKKNREGVAYRMVMYGLV